MQEIIAFGIVAIAVLVCLVHFYRKYVAPVLSEELLKRGKVKWAMRVRGHRRH